jgi:DNA-binding NtrC family response regulator
MSARVLRALCVVIAERDGDVRAVISDVLEAQGARARRASNTDELILVLRGAPCDALVVEADLWRLGGARLRDAIGRLPRAPAVVLTGDWPGASEPPGDVRLLEKPFSAGALVAALAAALSSRAAG